MDEESDTGDGFMAQLYYVRLGEGFPIPLSAYSGCIGHSKKGIPKEAAMDRYQVTGILFTAAA